MLYRIAVCIGLLYALPAHAATVTVNALGDAGPGTCASTCTLRDAITSAAPDDVITFASTLNFPATIKLSGQQILLYKNLTIQGPGASLLSISGNNQSRLFEIAGSASVSVSGLTLTLGVAYGAPGGVDSLGNGLPAGLGTGGAFLVNAGSTLQIVACVLSNNAAIGGSGSNSHLGSTPGSGGPARGGAIASAGMLLIANTTLVRNEAYGGSPGYSGGGANVPGTAGGNAQGGAIYATGATEVSNSQFLNNHALPNSGGFGGTASGGDGGSAYGGALATSGFTALAFVSAAGNTAVPGSGGTTGGHDANPGINGSGAGSDIFATATVLSRYSALTSTTTGTVDGTIATCAITNSTTQGANLDADGSCLNYSLHGDANLQIVSSGGSTFAFPRWGSTLIDAAADCSDGFATTVSDDVRGGVRPLDANADGTAACDLGAVESDELFANGFE